MNEQDTPKIAVLCLEEGHVPRGLVQLESLRGNSTNLDTYPFPVRLCRIEGANVESVLENPSPVVLQRMISESQKLIRQGIRAITTSCGFNAVFQKELTRALPVPVFTSSLLQVPFVRNLLPPDQAIAVITAKSSALKDVHLRAAGIVSREMLQVLGMEHSPEWNKIFTKPEEKVDLETVAREVVMTAKKAMEGPLQVGAFVLECTDLPPFSTAVREATGKPVFDFQTMMYMIAQALGIVSTF